MSDVRFLIDPNVHSLHEVRRELQKLAFQGKHIFSYYDGDLELIVHDGILLAGSLANADAPNGSIFYSTDDGVLSYKDSGGTVDSLEESGGGGGSAPETARIFFDAAKPVTGTWVRYVYNTDQPYQMGVYCDSEQVGDRLIVGFDLAAGEYELNVIGIEDAGDRCEVEWFIDGVSVWANDDWRAGGGYNTLHTENGIVISDDGYHTLEVEITAVGADHGWAAFTTAWFVPNDGDWSP